MIVRNTSDKNVDNTEDDEEGSVDEKYLVGKYIHLFDTKIMYLMMIRRAIPARNKDTNYGRN